MHLTFGDIVTLLIIAFFLTYGYFGYVHPWLFKKDENQYYQPYRQSQKKPEPKVEDESVIKKWYPDHVVSPDEYSMQHPKVEIRVESIGNVGEIQDVPVLKSKTNKESKDFNTPAEAYVGQKSSKRNKVEEDDQNYSLESPAGRTMEQKLQKEVDSETPVEVTHDDGKLFNALGEEVDGTEKEIEVKRFTLRLDLVLRDDEFDATYEKGILVNVVTGRYDDVNDIISVRTKVESFTEVDRTRKKYNKQANLMEQTFEQNTPEHELLDLVIHELIEYYGRKAVVVLEAYWLKTPNYLPQYIEVDKK